MVREGIATTNPATEVFLLPTQKKLPNYLNIAEQEKVLATVATRTDLVGRRDYAVVATGLRCSELANLQLGHLDLTFAGTGLKPAGQAANIPVTDD